MGLKWIRGGGVFGPFDGNSEDRSLAVWDGTDANLLTDSATYIDEDGRLVLGANTAAPIGTDYAISLTARRDWALTLPNLTASERDLLTVEEGSIIFNDEVGTFNTFDGSWRTLVQGPLVTSLHALPSWDDEQGSRLKNTKTFISEFGGLTIGQNLDSPSPTQIALYLSEDDKVAVLNRMTNTNRNEITGLIDGMLVFNTTFEAFHYYNATAAAWKGIISGPGDATTLNSIPTFITTLGELVDTPTYLDESTGAAKFGENATPAAKVHAWDGDSGAPASSNRQIVTETAEAGGGLQLRGLTTTELGIHFGVPGSAVHGAILYVADGNTGLAFRTGNSGIDRLRINNDGFVGVGDIEASSKLQVDGSFAVKRQGSTAVSIDSSDEVIIAIAGGNSEVVSAVISAAGSGYVENEVLTIIPGTGSAATLEVLTVDGGGAVTSAFVTFGGDYSTFPGSPAATSASAFGVGATFLLTEGFVPVAPTIRILTADIIDDRVFWIQDETGAASPLNPITVTSQSGTINGASSVQITEAYGSIMMYAQGGNLYAR